MRNSHVDLTPGIRHYIIATHAVAVAHDRALDERTVLDRRGWGDGSSSSSSSPSGMSFSNNGSSLSSSISGRSINSSS